MTAIENKRLIGMTDFLFENNHEPKHSFTWEHQQPRVIEKLAVLKEVK